MIRKIVLFMIMTLYLFNLKNVYGSEINIKDTFVDEKISKNISHWYDTDKNGYLSDNENKAITKLWYSTDEKIDLTGLDKLTNLNELLLEVKDIENSSVINNMPALDTLDIDCKTLTNFKIVRNELEDISVCVKTMKAIDLSGIKHMKYCSIGIPDLKTVVPVKGNIDELSILAVGDTKNTINKFEGAKKLYINLIEKKKSLVIRDLKNVTYIRMNGKLKKNLTITKCNKLKKINFDTMSDFFGLDGKMDDGLKVNKLLITNCKKLESADVDEVHSKQIKIENNKKLKIVKACRTKINLKKAPNLKEIKLRHITNKKIDLGSFHKLEKVVLTKSKTKSVKLPKKNKIKYLNLSNNKLTGINLKYLKKAKTVYLQHNKLKKLNVTKMKNVNILNLSYNKIKHIDIRNLIRLNEFKMNYNKLQGTIYLPKIKRQNQGKFYLNHNKITSIISPKHSQMEQLICEYNKLGKIDLKDAPVYMVDITHNPRAIIYFTWAEFFSKDKNAIVHHVPDNN